jgi:hypothetical protein
MRACGGVYFVPREQDELLGKVLDFLTKIGASGCWISDASETIKGKGLQMLVEGMCREVHDLQAEILELSQREKGISRTQAKNRLGELQEKLDKIRLFAASLGADANSVLQKCSTSQIDMVKLAEAGDNGALLARMVETGEIEDGALAQLVRIAAKSDSKPAAAQVAPVEPEPESEVLQVSAVKAPEFVFADEEL